MGHSPWCRKESDTTERLHSFILRSLRSKEEGGVLLCSYTHSPFSKKDTCTGMQVSSLAPPHLPCPWTEDWKRVRPEPQKGTRTLPLGIYSIGMQATCCCLPTDKVPKECDPD